MLITSYEIHFTSKVTDAIVEFSTEPKSLEKLSDSCKSTLLKTVKLLHGELSKLQVLALGVLVVLQVKQRDIAEELSSKEVGSVEHFDWLS